MIVDTQEIGQALLKDGAVRDAIARRAFLFFCERGYSEQHHLFEDWFRAESEILSILTEQEVARRQRIDAATSETAMAEETISSVVQASEALEPVAEPPKAQVAAKKTARPTKKDGGGAEKTARKASSKPKAK